MVLLIKGVEDSTDIKVIAARLQEIDEKARTKGEYNKIGEIYGFSIMVKTESTSKDLFDCSVNRFFVKGQESIYYTYNNGKLASETCLPELYQCLGAYPEGNRVARKGDGKGRSQ